MDFVKLLGFPFLSSYLYGPFRFFFLILFVFCC